MTTQLNDKLIAVEVPPDARSFLIDTSGDLSYEYDIVSSEKARTGLIAIEYLPKDSKWRVIGLCTPQEIGFNVDIHFPHCTVYEPCVDYLEDCITHGCNIAIQSFRSLLQSKSLDAGKNYLIIEKI